MQAIEDLEPVRRGVYCGAIGWIDGDRGRAELAVAIRTFTIAGRGRTSASVAASSPTPAHDAEWAETELKGARLLQAVGAYETEPVRGPMTAWVDGALVPLAEAKVSVLDHGLVVGDGVFETCASTAACRSHGAGTWRACAPRPTASASTCPTSPSCAARPRPSFGPTS